MAYRLMEGKRGGEPGKLRRLQSKTTWIRRMMRRIHVRGFEGEKRGRRTAVREFRVFLPSKR